MPLNKECDCLLKLFLGQQYHMFTAAMQEESYLPSVTNVKDGCDMCLKAHATLVYESKAVNNDGRRSNRYYLPNILQEHIKQRTGLSLDFSSDRFVIEDEETMVKHRKRAKG